MCGRGADSAAAFGQRGAIEEPTTAPLFDPMPSAEDFSNISAESYGEQLALLTSMTERLHLQCSNSSMSVSKSDPQVAQERIHEMLNILQQIAADYAKSGVHRRAANTEEFNLLQQLQSMLVLSVIFEVTRYRSSALGGQAFWHRHRMEI
jgi:hypothetical protein